MTSKAVERDRLDDGGLRKTQAGAQQRPGKGKGKGRPEEMPLFAGSMPAEFAGYPGAGGALPPSARAWMRRRKKAL